MTLTAPTRSRERENTYGSTVGAERKRSMAVPAKSGAGEIYPSIVAQIRGKVLSGAELGRLTGVSERQVHRWISGASRPDGSSRTRLLEVNYVIQALRDVYTEDGVEVWLHGPNRNFGGRKPIEMLEEGDFAEVLQEIERLTVGADQ